MNDAQFDYVADLVRSRIGVVVKPGQVYLAESRLAALARKIGGDSIAEVVDQARVGGNERVADMIIDAMTTNETLFFRDRAPFDHLRDAVLPELTGKGTPVRIWCAACSTGQEPYSLAMTLQANPRFAGTEIVATDISELALAQAREGVYSQFEVQRGLPLRMLMDHFTQDGERWRLSESVAKRVTFISHNLMKPAAHLGRFDVVLCRNVLIYFDKENKKKVLDRIAAQMQPDGYLLLGAAETSIGLTRVFQEMSGVPGLYRRVATAALASGEAA